MTSQSAPEGVPQGVPPISAPVAAPTPAFAGLREQTAAFFQFWGQLAMLLTESIWFVVRGRIPVRETIRQMDEVGVGSLVVALITVGFSGAVAGLYAAAQLVQYGQGSYTGGFIGKSLALEIAPVITAIVVSARSGSSMAAEIGSMTVTEQVDALRTMAVSPVEYLVVPRVLGTMLMMPIVTAIALFTGIWGGSITAEMSGVSSTLYWRSVQEIVSTTDVVTGLCKSIPFGLLISLIGCRQGLTTIGGAQGVGRATTSAVVLAATAIYVTDFFISLIFQDVTTAGVF